MKTLTAALVALFLTGCALVSEKVQLPAGQALLVAEATADGINHGATVAANAGLINGAKALTVKAGVDGVNHCVSGAHEIYAHGDVPATVKELNICFAKAAEVQTLIHPKVQP